MMSSGVDSLSVLGGLPVRLPSKAVSCRSRCPACWSTDLAWREASGRGRVITYSVVHQGPFESYAQDTPYVLAVIRLEEDPQIIANVLDVDPERMSDDMPVEVTFEERSGGFRMRQFQPALPS
jgi:uncharacterized OB-fold protein